MSEYFYAKSKNGLLVFDNPRALSIYLNKVDGKSLFVQIDKEYGVRSGSQNSWYWGVVLKTIADVTGDSERELHELFKRLFLPPQYKKILGREVKLPASTTRMNKVDFGEYIEKIRAEVAKIGITIPDPK